MTLLTPFGLLALLALPDQKGEEGTAADRTTASTLRTPWTLAIGPKSLQTSPIGSRLVLRGQRITVRDRAHHPHVLMERPQVSSQPYYVPPNNRADPETVSTIASPFALETSTVTSEIWL